VSLHPGQARRPPFPLHHHIVFVGPDGYPDPCCACGTTWTHQACRTGSARRSSRASRAIYACCTRRAHCTRGTSRPHRAGRRVQFTPCLCTARSEASDALWPHPTACLISLGTVSVIERAQCSGSSHGCQSCDVVRAQSRAASHTSWRHNSSLISIASLLRTRSSKCLRSQLGGVAAAFRYAYTGALLSVLQDQLRLSYWDYQLRADRRVWSWDLSLLTSAAFDSVDTPGRRSSRMSTPWRATLTTRAALASRRRGLCTCSSGVTRSTDLRKSAYTERPT